MTLRCERLIHLGLRSSPLCGFKSEKSSFWRFLLERTSRPGESPDFSRVRKGAGPGGFDLALSNGSISKPVLARQKRYCVEVLAGLARWVSLPKGG